MKIDLEIRKICNDLNIDFEELIKANKCFSFSNLKQLMLSGYDLQEIKSISDNIIKSSLHTYIDLIVDYACNISYLKERIITNNNQVILHGNNNEVGLNASQIIEKIRIIKNK